MAQLLFETAISEEPNWKTLIHVHDSHARPFTNARFLLERTSDQDILKIDSFSAQLHGQRLLLRMCSHYNNYCSQL